jgi:hypothetical protein
MLAFIASTPDEVNTLSLDWQLMSARHYVAKLALTSDHAQEGQNNANHGGPDNAISRILPVASQELVFKVLVFKVEVFESTQQAHRSFSASTCACIENS